LQSEVIPQVDVDNIFCLGNGRMAAYESGADMIQLFGPPYSSPSLLQMQLKNNDITVESNREPGTAIWIHTLRQEEEVIGSITDFVDSKLPCLIRKFDLKKEIEFSLSLNEKVNVIDNSSLYKNENMYDVLLIESPRGIPFYNDYPMTFKQYLQIAAKGNAEILEKDSKSYQVKINLGESYLYFVGGPLYPECITNSKAAIIETSYEILLSRTSKWWNDFTSRRIDFSKTLSSSLPEREKLLQTIDDVAINIKTQQAVEGGVLAGHNYHMGYIRDQYGVARCLLALGYFKEAKTLLSYYWNIWKQKGKLHNAQGLGIDAFHVHENDEVEITGSLIIQSFDYLKKSNDVQFVKEIFPMLTWAWNSQEKNLVKGMLPFNGDETYIAGGVYPRDALNNGSAEATMLFITGGKQYLSFAEENNLLDKQTLANNKKVLEETVNSYRENFFDNNELATNNPSREEGLELPQFRHGVCEGGGESCEFFCWTQKTETNRYLCPVCYVSLSLPEVVPQKYYLQSVSLMPLYINSYLFSEKELKEMVDGIINYYKVTHKFPSRPGGDITVGYDYGLLLYNLVKLNYSEKIEIYKKMMSVLDESGAWVEYYKDGKPKGTRYRPWESSINLEAAILFGQSFGR
jgi:hypothetical protein